MAIKKRSRIGFSQVITTQWLDLTANHMLRNTALKDIRSSLDETLAVSVSVNSDAKRNDRQKTISILLRTWARPHPSLESFRDEGLELFSMAPNGLRRCAHYGMAISSYPFTAAVAETLGRLFRLQGYAKGLEVQLRMKERFGPRQTVSRATRGVLRSFTDWGFIRSGEMAGKYIPAGRIRITDPGMARWLVEAALNSTESGSGLFQALVSGPALFPFELDIVRDRAPVMSERVEVISHGWDDFILKLRFQKLAF